MKVGSNIKNLRVENNLTQKDLADKLFLTYQAISRYENDEVEPNLDILQKMSEIFNCSLEDLIYGKEKEVTKFECKECLNVIEGEGHKVERKEEEVMICDKCFEEETNLKKEYDKLLNLRYGGKEIRGIFDPSDANEDNRRGIIFGIVFSIAALIGLLIVFIQRGMDIGSIIGITILTLYLVFAEVYCCFSISYIADVFAEICGWSLKLPGIIFEFDLDGIMRLIGIKILFGILTFFFSILIFLFNISLTTLLSAVSFPFILIKNIKGE